jgi:hypothetical protein
MPGPITDPVDDAHAAGPSRWGHAIRVTTDEIVTRRPLSRNSGIGQLYVWVRLGAVVSDGGL